VCEARETGIRGFRKNSRRLLRFSTMELARTTSPVIQSAKARRSWAKALACFSA
jgi:hypothetical protein